jgi:hypothetical protein
MWMEAFAVQFCLSNSLRQQLHDEGLQKEQNVLGFCSTQSNKRAAF